jgi:hypothetical protein
MEVKRPDALPSTPAHPARRSAPFETVAILLLSLATVGTAWCSFKASVWGGSSQRKTNLSAAASRRAAAGELQSYQEVLLDVLLFSQHINARVSSNEPLARFYSDRFRGEAKAAFNSWLATQPFTNPDAPAHPFLTNYYHPRRLEVAREAEEESQRLWQEAGEAGRNSREYALVTVSLATALFCGGTAPKFETLWVRRGVLALGLSAFLFAAVRLFSLAF